MNYDKATLRKIYDRTDGRCHICRKKLSFVNRGKHGRRGAWEVEHSKPKAMGGSNYFRNLYPACISCNREKGMATTKTARSWYGRTRAPLSKEKKKENRASNVVIGGFVGGLAGLCIAPWVAIAGVIVGAVIGNNIESEA